MICMFKAIHYLLLLFENFGNMCAEMYELNPANFLSASGLARQTALEKTKVKLDLLTNIDILIIEKNIKRRNMSFYLSICDN